MPRKKNLEKNAENDLSQERRKAARLDIPIKVQYRVTSLEEVKEAVTRNISAGGCLLLAGEALEVGLCVELSIFLGASETESLVLNGKIVRQMSLDNGRNEFGVEFENMSRDARHLFAEFCFARMYEMIGLSGWPTDRSQK